MFGISLLDSKRASDITTILIVISLLALAAKLLALKRFETHRPFIVLAVFWAFSNALPLWMNTNSLLYFQIYLALVPVSWMLYILVSRRLYQSVFKDFAGIAWAGKWALNIAGSVALIFLFLSLVRTDAPFAASHSLTGVMVIDSGLACGLCFLLVVLVVAVWFYPVEIRRNIVVHCIFFSAIFFTIALANLIVQAAHFEHTDRVNVIGGGVSAILCIVWIIRVNTQGDIRLKTREPQQDPSLETRLLNQLHTLNEVLVRVNRK